MINASFIGNLGRDAETRKTGSGSVTNFSVAVRGREKDVTEWVECSMWGDRGTKICAFLTKGSKVFVNGELTRREFQKRDGSEGTSLQVMVNNVEFAGPKPTPDSNKPQNLPEIPF